MMEPVISTIFTKKSTLAEPLTSLFSVNFYLVEYI